MPRTSHPAALALVVLAAALLSGCGSSGSTTTSPAAVTRCAITLNSVGTVPAAGGSGTLTVSATRECAWSASVEGTWLSIRSGSSGQGEGTVEFAAAANPDPQPRTGSVVVNGTRAQISQAAGECVFSLHSASSDFPPAGGSATIQVLASSPLCSWTAVPNDEWISISSGANGRGNGATTISVPSTTGPPRAGSVTIAGQQHSVTQSQGCTYALDSTAHAAPATGGPLSVRVTTAPACPWTAASNAPWITVSPASSSGPGAVALTVAATQGPSRSGTLVIAGQLVTVTQSPGCSYSVEPEARSLPATGGTASVRVTTGSACSWSAVSHVPWITVQGTSSGAGTADVTFAAESTEGPSRTGTLSVAGRTVTVTQTQGCEYTLSPERQSVGSSGGSGKVAVTAGGGCAWTATSSAPWLTITSPTSGSGSGEVQFTVAATSGPARSATLTIGGRTFTVDQGQACTYTLSASSASVDNAGGSRSFEVQAADGCSWTASSTAGWISLTAGSSGSGNGTVSFTVAPNSGPDRTGTITAAGQTFTVTQGAGCTSSLSADRQNVAASGGTGTVGVSVTGGCAWTASSNAPWLTITSGGTGTGNGSVGFTAAANPGPPRTGTLTIAGRTFTVEQASGCTYTLSPPSRQVPASGGATSVTVATTASCAWTAVSNVPWISVTGGSGTGDGTVQMMVAANTGAARSGTVTVGGQTFTVTQEGGCTFAVSPENPSSPSSGGSIRVEVAASAGCAWTAVSNAPWISVPTDAGGVGSGQVDLTVAANSGPARSGTVTIAGRTITVTQGAGCTVALNPTSQTMSGEEGTGTIAVTAPAGCTWTAVSSESWLTVTSGSPGSGAGTVGFSVRRNPSGRLRTATITIGDKVFTVSQQ